MPRWGIYGRAVGLWMVLAGASAGGLAAEIPEELLMKVFAGEKTPAGRAARLLEAAGVAQGDPAMQVALLKKAVEYGLSGLSSAEGRETTQTALDRLASVSEKDADFCQAKRLDLYRLWYTRYARLASEKLTVRGRYVEALRDAARAHEQAGMWAEAVKAYADAGKLASRPPLSELADIQRDYKMAVHMRVLQRKIDTAASQLKTRPTDTTARMTLIKLLVIEKDDPNQAAQYLTDEVEQVWRTCVPQAIPKPFELKATLCKEMGDWYSKVLAKEASEFAKGDMLSRAVEYYDRFLASQPRAAEKLMVALARKDLTEELGKFTARRDAGGPGGSLTLDLGKRVSLTLRGIPPRKVNAAEMAKGKMAAALPYYIGITEVTQEQYEAVMGTNPSRHKAPGNPVTNVSWHDAREFCEKLSAKTGRNVRLPTGAEWHHARCAGTKTTYYWGNDPNRMGEYEWCKVNTVELGPSHDHPHPVGRRKPNPWGLYDMLGNVWEWMYEVRGGEVKPGETQETSKAWRLGLGNDWRGDCNPDIYADADPWSGYDSWGFRVVVDYE